MTPIRFLLLCGLLALASAGCQRPERKVRNLVVTGSSCMTPLLREMGQRFQQSHPDVRVDVQTRGSARGASDARQGLADIGMVARPLKPEESMLHATPIARDGMCLIVHRTNLVKSLSDDQVIRIYTRGVNNWKQVGGPDRPISLVQMTEGQALLELFLDHFKLKTTQIRADALARDSEQAIQAVTERPGALAYVSCSHADSAGANAPIRELSCDGITPTMEHVRGGTYPLSRPLNLVTREEPGSLAREFIDFARSNAAVDLIEKHHFVTLEK